MTPKGHFEINSPLVIMENFGGGQIPQKKSRDKDAMWNCLNLMTLLKKVSNFVRWAMSMAGFVYGMT